MPHCRKARDAERREEFKNNDPLGYRLHQMADGIVRRTKYAVHKPKNKTYLERGIENRLGNTFSETREVLTENFWQETAALIAMGEKPSVDRIDPYGHYELGNIRIVSLKENLAAVKPYSVPVTVFYPDGNVRTFTSVKAAATELGIKRDTIYANAKNGTISRKGFRFVI